MPIFARVRRIGKHSYNIDNRKIPFVIFPDTTNFLIFENDNFIIASHNEFYLKVNFLIGLSKRMGVI